MKRIPTLLVVVVLTAGSAQGGAIESACNKLPSSSNPSLCSCIQRVADTKLNRSDQRLAAKFFADPHLAQETRQSNNQSKEKFWLRYKDWGQTAATTCST